MWYWNYWKEPSKYTDDIYHVGSANAPAWVIKSTDGLILLDTGLPQTLYQLMENLRKMNFDYHDIKHIMHSHGHIDHIGGTRALAELTGAKTYIGEGDLDMVTGKNQLQWTNEFGIAFEEPFEPDVIIKDGDKITIGEKTFSFVACPGHSQGTLSIFFNCYDKGVEYRAGMFGGAGKGTMTKAYLERYDLSFDCRKQFIESIDKVIDEKVDVHLGNHLGDNKHSEKLEKSLATNYQPNAFIDQTTWRWFLERRRAEALRQFADPEF